MAEEHKNPEQGPPMPSFLNKNAPPSPKEIARQAGTMGIPPLGSQVAESARRQLPPDHQAQSRDTRDIRELAQQIDGLMFEIIERLQNLNGWLGQLPRVK